MSQPTALTHWLVHHAARSAPAPLADRLEEEWQADLLARPSSMSRLRFALGCCWATKLIALEHRTSSVPVSASTMGNIAFLHEESSFLSRRSMSLFLVVCLHAALFYALMISLGATFTKAIEPPLQNQVLEPTRAHDPPPPPPPLPNISHRRMGDLTLPKIQFPPDGNDDGEIIRGKVNDPRPPPPQPQPSHVVNRVQGGPGLGFPNPDDYYPAAAIRGQEQGNIIVQVCVDPNGRLTSDPKAVQSSGHARLDAGALILAKAGSGHYRASTDDGKPVSACYPFRVVFKLKS
jgi:TonB family protein